MLVPNTVKLRLLPDGAAREGRDAGWENAVFHVDLVGAGDDFTPGAAVEIECGSKLFLGEVRQCSDTHVAVRVEHALDCDRLASIQRTWG